MKKPETLDFTGFPAFKLCPGVDPEILTLSYEVRIYAVVLFSLYYFSCFIALDSAHFLRTYARWILE